MKTKQIAQVTISLLAASIFWAGCASEAPLGPNGQPVVENTIDLQNTGPDTHPELRTGNYDPNLNGNWDVESIE